MRKKFLLGATKDKEIVFGEYEITTRNGYPEFTACFEAVIPFKGDDVDLEEYFENFVDDVGHAYAYELCERYHCSPQDLSEKLADDCYDVRDALDCSLYPEIFKIDDDEWFFESGSCGQHDTRNDMDEYVDKRVYDMLHDVWDKYHLKDIRKYDEENKVRETLLTIETALSKVDEEEWIENYIRRNFYEED